MVFSYFEWYDLDSLGPRTLPPILLVLQPSLHPGMWLPLLPAHPSPGLSHSSQGTPGVRSEQSCLLPGGQEEQCFQSGRIDTWNCPRGWQGANVLEEHCAFMSCQLLKSSSCSPIIMFHIEDYGGFLYLYVCVHCCSDDSSSGLAGSLGHLGELLTRDWTAAICYLFCLCRIFTPTHSATGWMKWALVLCVRKKEWK